MRLTAIVLSFAMGCATPTKFEGKCTEGITKLKDGKSVKWKFCQKDKK